MNTYPHGWKVEKNNEEMPLKATVRCGICDRPLTAYPQKGKYIYYKCPNNGCCVNVSNKKLHLLFEESLANLEVQSHFIPVIRTQLEATYWALHKSESVRQKPMKDELSKLKSELEAMELNLAIGKLSPELFEKHSSAHQDRIAAIEQELQILDRDTSNLTQYIDKTLEFARNLLKMWQNLDWTGKIRLQKLVFPEGMAYLPETHALRTFAVNPIFLAMTSISQILMADSGRDEGSEIKKLQSLYLMFRSSNFLWGNLVEMANILVDLQKIAVLVPYGATSATGSTSMTYVSNSSDSLEVISGTRLVSQSTYPFTGSNISTRIAAKA